MGYLADRLRVLSEPVVVPGSVDDPGPTEDRSFLGFLGNFIGGVPEIAGGLGALVGMGVHDTLGLLSMPFGGITPDAQQNVTVGGGVGYGQATPSTGRFMLDDLFINATGWDPLDAERSAATPSVVREDFVRRYGGEGGAAVLDALYEEPLSYLGDVLTLASLGSYGAAKGAQIAGRTTSLANAASAVTKAKAVGGLDDLVRATTEGTSGLTTGQLRAGRLMSAIQGTPKTSITRDGTVLTTQPAFSPYRRLYSNATAKFGTQDITSLESRVGLELEALLESGAGDTARINSLQQILSSINSARAQGISRIQRATWNDIQMRRFTDRWVGTSSLRAIQERGRVSDRVRMLFKQTPSEVTPEQLVMDLEGTDLGFQNDDLAMVVTEDNRGRDVIDSLTERGSDIRTVMEAMRRDAFYNRLRNTGTSAAENTLRASNTRKTLEGLLETFDGLKSDEYNVLAEVLRREFPEEAQWVTDYETMMQRVAAFRSGRSYLVGIEDTTNATGRVMKLQVHNRLSQPVGELVVQQLRDDPSVIHAGHTDSFMKRLTEAEAASVFDDIRHFFPDARQVIVPVRRVPKTLAGTVFDEVIDVLNPETNRTRKVRRLRAFYHGGEAFEGDFDPARSNPQNYFGPGAAYFTDNPEVAGGFPVDVRIETPATRRTYLDIRRPFEARIDQPWEDIDSIDKLLEVLHAHTPEMLVPIPGMDPIDVAHNDLEAVADVARQAFEQTHPMERAAGFNDYAGFVNEHYGWNMQWDEMTPQQSRMETAIAKLQVMFGMVESGEAIPGQIIYDFINDIAVGRKDLLNEHLAQMGYDSIVHTGGFNTGGINHTAVVVFDPKRIVSAIAIDGLERGRQISSRLSFNVVPLNPPPRAMVKMNLPNVGVVERGAREYIKARRALGRSDRLYLDPVDEASLSDRRVFVTGDGSGGYTLTPEGEIRGLFTAPNAPLNARTLLVMHALENGARTWSGFDGVEAKLMTRFGFRVTDHQQFSFDLQPKGWDVNTMGTPGVVRMTYEGGDFATLPDRYGRFPSRTEPFTRQEAMALQQIPVRVGGGTRPPLGAGEPAPFGEGMGEVAGSVLTRLQQLTDPYTIKRIMTSAGLTNSSETMQQVMSDLIDIQVGNALTPEGEGRVQEFLGAFRREIEGRSSEKWLVGKRNPNVDPPDDGNDWFWSDTYGIYLHWQIDSTYEMGGSSTFWRASAYDQNGTQMAEASGETYEHGLVYINTQTTRNVATDEMYDFSMTRHDSPLGVSGELSFARALSEQFPFIYRGSYIRASGARHGAARTGIERASVEVPDHALYAWARTRPDVNQAITLKHMEKSIAHAVALEQGLAFGSEQFREFVADFKFPGWATGMGFAISPLAGSAPMDGLARLWADFDPTTYDPILHRVLALVPDPDGRVRAHLRSGQDLMDFDAGENAARVGPGIPLRGRNHRDIEWTKFDLTFLRRIWGAYKDTIDDLNPEGLGLNETALTPLLAAHSQVENLVNYLESIESLGSIEVQIIRETLDNLDERLIEGMGINEFSENLMESKNDLIRMMEDYEPGDIIVELDPSARVLRTGMGTGMQDETTTNTLSGPVLDALREFGTSAFVRVPGSASTPTPVRGVLFDGSAITEVDGLPREPFVDEALFKQRLANAGYDFGNDSPGIAAAELADAMGGEADADVLDRLMAMTPEDRYRVITKHGGQGRETAAKVADLSFVKPRVTPNRAIRRTEDFGARAQTSMPGVPSTGVLSPDPLFWEGADGPGFWEDANMTLQDVVIQAAETFGWDSIIDHRVKGRREITERVAELQSFGIPEANASLLDDLVGVRVRLGTWGELPQMLDQLNSMAPVHHVTNTVLTPGKAGDRVFKAVVNFNGKPVEFQFATDTAHKVQQSTWALRRWLRWAETRMRVEPSLASNDSLLKQVDAAQRLLEGINEAATDDVRFSLTNFAPSEVRNIHMETRLMVAEEFERGLLEFYGLDGFNPVKMLERQYRPMMMQRGSYFDSKTGEWVNTVSAQELDDMVRLTGMAQPVYFPHFDFRRVKASDFIVARKTTGIRKMTKPGYEKQFKGYLTAEDYRFILTNPTEAYSRRAALAVRREEALDLVQFLTKKFGHRVQSWEELGEHEVLFAPDGFLRFYRMRQGFDDSVLQSLIEAGDELDDLVLANKLRKAVAHSQDEVADLLDRVNRQVGLTKNGVELWAVPKVVMNRIEASVSPRLGMKTRLAWDTPLQTWRALVLQGSPRWVINNVIGNFIFLKMQGGRLSDVLRQMNPRYRAKLDLVIGKQQLPAVTQGLVDSLPTTHLGIAAETKVGRAYTAIGQSGPVRMSRALVGEPMKRLNNAIEDAFRRASYLTAAERTAVQAGVKQAARRFWTSKNSLDTVARVGIDEKLAMKAIDEMNYFMNDYSFLTPFGRQIMRRFLVPFWSFYRHVGKLLLTFPVTHPARAQVLGWLTQTAEEMSQEFGPMPEWATGAVPLGPGNEPGETRFLSTAGPNPFSGFARQFNAASMLAPPWKVLIEQSMGRSTLTGRAFSDPQVITPFGSDRNYRVIQRPDGSYTTKPVDRVAPSLIEHLLQQVPQYELAKDVIAGGRTYDTSSLYDVIRARMDEDAIGGVIRDPATGQARYPTDIPQRILSFGGLSTFDINQVEEGIRQREESLMAIRSYLRRIGVLPPSGASSATQSTLESGPGTLPGWR